MERGIEGGYNFLSAIAGTETCSEMNRALEHFELLRLVKSPDCLGLHALKALILLDFFD